MSSHKRFTRKCVSCGAEIPNSGSARKFCEKCAKERHRKKKREYMRKIRNSGEYKSPANENKPKKSNSMQRINDIARCAKNDGMSYGEYLAKRREKFDPRTA